MKILFRRVLLNLKDPVFLPFCGQLPVFLLLLSLESTSNDFLYLKNEEKKSIKDTSGQKGIARTLPTTLIWFV